MVAIAHLYSPSIVLGAWAALVALGLESPAVTVVGLVALALALAAHVREERRRVTG